MAIPELMSAATLFTTTKAEMATMHLHSGFRTVQNHECSRPANPDTKGGG
jgi:hypothetical protein